MFGPPQRFTIASTCSWLGHSVSGLRHDTSHPFQIRFRFGFVSLTLNPHHIVTRRPVLQKVRYHTRMVLYLLVSSRFQVLFHSPPGVLFTFPSRYYSLSVTWSYLAFGDGPPFFRQDFSCPDVLWILLAPSKFRLQEFHLLCSTFPGKFDYPSDCYIAVLTPKTLCLRFGLVRFRSPLLSESLLFSFPPGT